VLAEALRRRGFVTSEACSAIDCLAHLEREPVDVVVTDIQMPGTSGTELCSELRRRHPDVVALVITGRSSLETAIAALHAGAYDYITKPVTIEELVLTVTSALEHRAFKRECARLRAASPSVTAVVA
jgi:DNA-binding NtrC family response regulator